MVAEGGCKNKFGILRSESQEFAATITMATPSSEEMVFETIQQLDCVVPWEVANPVGIPVTIVGLLKVVLRELSSVELEGAEIFKKIESLIKSLYNVPKITSF